MAVVVSTAPVVVSSSAAQRPTRRSLRHHPDPLLAVAVETVLVAASAVALSFSVVTATTVVTRPPAHSRAFFSLAPAAVRVLAVVVALMVVPVPVESSTAALGTEAVVGPTVVTRRTMFSTGAAAERATATAGRAPAHYRSLLSVALAAVEVAGLVVEVHSSAGRGAVGVVGSAVAPRSVRYVVEGLPAVLVAVTVAAGSVGRSADRSAGFVDSA